MVATRRKSVAADTTASPNGRNSALAGAAATPSEDGYEKQREERIRENMERMQKLGILDLSHQLKKPLPSPRTGGGLRTPLDPAKSLLLAPSRRSSRLKHVAPVSYAPPAEEEEPAAARRKKGMMIRVVEGEREEIYTEEHEKLLGSCETGWTLFVDGCGADGKRIYDSIKGKTCHQCRQKTLGHRTHCCKCNMVQGQFCGDCLFMRYGENVLEAKNDPNWICPVCRGICNCSLCRLKRGWAPTGALYKKVLSLGFKSVAHYLIQTRRRQANSSELQNSCQASSKKSLTFTDAEEDSSSLVKPENIIISPAEDKNKEDDKSNEKEITGPGSKHDDPPPTTVDKEVAAEKKQNSGRKSRKKGGEPAAASLVSRSPDSIASRLRSARKPPTVCNEESSAAELNNTTNTRKGRKKKEDEEPTAAVITSSTTSPADSIASRLRKRRLA